MKENIIDLNETIIKNFVKSIRPESAEIRAQIDFGYSYDGKITVIYEIRPLWDKPSEKQNIPFAKIRFHKSKKVWMLYWMRGSGKWELYEPFSESTYLDKIIEVIKADKHACFFG